MAHWLRIGADDPLSNAAPGVQCTSTSIPLQLVRVTTRQMTVTALHWNALL